MLYPQFVGADSISARPTQVIEPLHKKELSFPFNDSSLFFHFLIVVQDVLHLTVQDKTQGV